MERYGKKFFIGFLAGVGVFCLVSATGQAAEPKEIRTFKDWSALVLIENKTKICFMHGVPLKSAGNYTKRGDTYMQVTHRPNSKIRNEVSVTAGYAYKEGSVATLTIDGRKFVLFTQGDTAWAGAENPDDKVVAAMRAGRSMVVGGTSNRGTTTVDSYSLSGFSAAHSAINKACGMK